MIHLLVGEITMHELPASPVSVLFVIFVSMLTIYIRVVPEHQQFAVLHGWRCQNLKGPGIALELPWTAEFRVRLSLADSGELLGDNPAKFRNASVAVVTSAPIEDGQTVIFRSFYEGQILVILDSAKKKDVV